MEHAICKALLTSALLLSFVAPHRAIAGSEEAAGTTVNVLFEAQKEGEPGKWTFDPENVIIEPGDVLLYRLDGGSTEGWFFERLAVGEEEPEPTDFVDAGSTPKVMEFGELTVEALEVSERSIVLRFEGPLTEIMELGVLLDVSNGDRRHTSQDPQVIVKPGGS